MVLYVGSSDSGVWPKVASHKSMKMKKFATPDFTTELKNAQSQMIEESYRYIIVDVQQFSNSASDIAFVLNTIQNVIKGKIIVYAPGTLWNLN